MVSWLVLTVWVTLYVHFFRVVLFPSIFSDSFEVKNDIKKQACRKFFHGAEAE